MKSNTISWLGKASFEAMLIVFAVVLGFIVNEWRQDYRDTQESIEALSRIKIEVENNRAAVMYISKYHEDLSAALSEVLAEAPDAPLVDTFEQAAMSLKSPNSLIGDVLLNDDAWLTAQTVGALTKAEFATVQAIGKVYSLSDAGVQTTLRAIQKQLITEHQAFLADTNAVGLRRLSSSYQLLVSQERYLIQLYDELLTLLELQQL